MHCAAACSSVARLPPPEWLPPALLRLGTAAGLAALLLHPPPSKPSAASVSAGSLITAGRAPARRRRAGGGVCLIVNLPGRTVDGSEIYAAGHYKGATQRSPRRGWSAAAGLASAPGGGRRRPRVLCLCHPRRGTMD